MSEVRRRGRPRDAGTDRAILEAAREALLRGGYAGLSMEKVAAAAGVGKPTVYRRWSSKAALAGDAVQHAFATSVSAIRADTRHTTAARQLTALYRGLTSVAGDPQGAAMILALTAAAAESPREAESFYRHHTRALHEAVVDCVRTGVESGEFRAETGHDAVADALIGSVVYQLLTGPRVSSPARSQDLLDILLAGLRLPSGQPPPAAHR